MNFELGLALEVQRSQGLLTLTTQSQLESLTDAIHAFDHAHKRLEASFWPWVIACVAAPLMLAATVFFYFHAGFPYGFFWVGVLGLAVQATWRTRREAREVFEVAQHTLVRRGQETTQLVSFIEHGWSEAERLDYASLHGLPFLLAALRWTRQRVTLDPYPVLTPPPPEPHGYRHEALPAESLSEPPPSPVPVVAPSPLARPSEGCGGCVSRD